MKRTIGTTRMAVAGMVLMGAALAMFGNMQSAATNHIFPRAPRTEQEDWVQVRMERASSTRMDGLSLAARDRSGDGDSCILSTRVPSRTHEPVIC